MSTYTGLFGGDGVELIDEQIFTSSGTWNKPGTAGPDDLVEILLWGAGGFAAGTTAKAGGGACNHQFVRARDLPSSVAAIVAAATIGTSSAMDGATSQFGKFKAFGGSGAEGTNGRGPGGGILGPGDGARGGPPAGGEDDSNKQPPGKWGGGATGTTWRANFTEYGGSGPDGDAVHGGAGADGKSLYGGDGATTDVDAQAPGGGGKGSATASRRYGARGEIRVRIWRGI